MNRKPVPAISEPYPVNLRPYLLDAPVYDSSCSERAHVYFVERNGGYFLKIAPAETLFSEAEMTDYFHKKGLAPEVVFCNSCYEGYDYLLTKRLHGEDATHARFLSDPVRLATLLGKQLRALHETGTKGCPISNRTRKYCVTVRKNRAEGRFDPIYFKGFGDTDQAAVWKVAKKGMPLLESNVLLHGDYCLPNIILGEDWSLSGFIDLDHAGIGDRHIDLYWGAWSLCYNLGTDAYRNTFFDAYGRDLINLECIRTVAACECFG